MSDTDSGVKRQPNIILKAPDMEKYYSKDPDFFGNRQHRRYAATMGPTIDRILDITRNVQGPVRWCDLGCGSGELLEAVVDRAASVERLIHPVGVDISQSALDYCIKETTLGTDFFLVDLERIDPSTGYYPWAACHVISLIDVMYYWGTVRPWRESFNTLWDTVSPGTIFILGDCIGRHQYRDYPKERGDIDILESYIEYSAPIDVSERNGRKFNHHLKLRILRK